MTRKRRGLSMTSILVLALVGTITAIVLGAMAVFLQTYQRSLIRSVQTSARQSVAQVGKTVEDYLDDVNSLMELLERSSRLNEGLLRRYSRRAGPALGGLLGMNDVSAAGMVASLANSIPMFGMVKDMDERGKIVNIAFAVPAAFVFGDHLGFTAGYDAAMLGPVIAAKLTGGVLAVLAALLFTRKKPAQNM